jgi:hypothetical protein
MDVDWVGNVSNRKLTNGFMFYFGSGAVSWSSKKQPIVALLNTKAEYRSVTITSCEVIWLQKLLSNLGQLVDVLVVICYDNVNSIVLVNNPVYHAKTKHIEVHYHFIREKVLVRNFNLIHVSTENQVVDNFTKALGTDKLRRFRRMHGVL